MIRSPRPLNKQKLTSLEQARCLFTSINLPVRHPLIQTPPQRLKDNYVPSW